MTQNDRQKILVETIREFSKKEWFRDATVYDSHPDSGEPTLEFKVNYVPLFERTEVKTFCLRFGLADRFLVVDRNGNPAE